MPAGAALRFTADAATSATLPGHYYHDEEIFGREAEEIFFKTSWQFVGFTFDLENHGDYITAGSSTRRCSWCARMTGACAPSTTCACTGGHVLAEGKGRKTIFTCPFHSWSYDTTGALRAAGNAENVAGFRLDDFHLAEVRVDTLGLLVFVNLDADAPGAGPLGAGAARGLARQGQALRRHAAHPFAGLRHRRQLEADLRPERVLPLRLGASRLRHHHRQARRVGITVEHARWLTHLMRSSEAVRRAPHRRSAPAPRPGSLAGRYLTSGRCGPTCCSSPTRRRPTSRSCTACRRRRTARAMVVYCLTRNDPPTRDDDDYNRTFTDEINLQDIAPMEKQQSGLRSARLQHGAADGRCRAELDQRARHALVEPAGVGGPERHAGVIAAFPGAV